MPLKIVVGPVLSGAVNDLIACHQRGGTVLVCGNGGSASDADHIVGELMKGFRLPRPLPSAEMTKLIALDPVWSELGLRLQQGIRAQSLVAHTALTSAIANDNSPDLIFAQQVHVIAKPGDIFIGLSTSGGSRNVVRAAEVARARGATVFAFTGSRTCALGALAHRWFAAPGSCRWHQVSMHQWPT